MIDRFKIQIQFKNTYVTWDSYFKLNCTILTWYKSSFFKYCFIINFRSVYLYRIYLTSNSKMLCISAHRMFSSSSDWKRTYEPTLWDYQDSLFINFKVKQLVRLSAKLTKPNFLSNVGLFLKKSNNCIAFIINFKYMKNY